MARAATPAITALLAAEIPHEVLRYHHDPQNESFGDEADHARLEHESVSHPDRLTHPYVDAPIVGQATRRLLEVSSQLTESRGFEYSCH